VEQAASSDLAGGEIAVGRVVASGVEEFDCECFANASAPAAGALVRTIDGPDVYAVVTSIETAGLDPSRPLVPHGSVEDDLETVLAANPHLPLLLHTTFHGRILGYREGRRISYGLPQRPPSLFARVNECDNVELRDFVAGLDFIEPLLEASGGEPDIVSAFLRQSSRSQPQAERFLLGAGRALVPLLSREPQRLTSILRRIRPDAG
jgi:hypothetical protein